MGSPDPMARRADAMIVLGVVGTGTVPLLVRSISASAPTIGVGTTWFAAGASVLIAALVGAPLTATVLRSSVPAGLAFALAQMMSYAAYQRTSLAIASLISCMSPLIVMVVATPLFGERLLPRQLACGVLALVGVIAVVLGAPDEGRNSLAGDLFACGSLLAGTSVLLLIKHRRMGGVSASPYAAGLFLVAAVAESVFWAFAPGDGSITGSEWLWLALLGLVLSGSVNCIAWAQRHANVAIASVLLVGAPVVTAVGARLLFDELLSATQIVGGLLVLGCLAGVVVRRPTHAEVTASRPSSSGEGSSR